ncbi:MAG: substrate-binding domain-containing protein [Opitutales bacterium]|nr:substrate-binding domain-containing protein [Opitutales bacterium]
MFKTSEDALVRQPVQILIDLALDFGYGRQMAAGLRRFRTKRPDWFFRAERIHTFFTPETEERVDGAVGHFSEEGERAISERMHVPFYVGVSNRVAHTWCPRVIVDDFAVGRMAAMYFLGRGYQHFGVLENPWDHYAIERTSGFQDCLGEAGFPPAQIFKPEGLDAPAVFRDRLPLALFALNDRGALDALVRLLGSGYRIPEDVAVLGVDNDETISLVSPVEISSIQLPLERIGFRACEVLESMIEAGKWQTGVQRFAPVQVIERRSTQGGAVVDARVRRAQAFIEDHLRRLSNVQELASALNMSRRSLERLFAGHLGVSPGDWIMRRRAERAEQLIRETDYTIEHVADLVGFEDRRRLYRAFHKFQKPLPRSLRSQQSVR